MNCALQRPPGLSRYLLRVRKRHAGRSAAERERWPGTTLVACVEPGELGRRLEFVVLQGTGASDIKACTGPVAATYPAPV